MPSPRNAISKGSSARQAKEYRDALIKAIRPEDIGGIVKALVKRAKDGDVAAAKLVLDRACGTEALADWPSESVIARTEWLDGFANPRS